MTEPNKPRISKWALVGFFIMGVAAFSGLGALITQAIQKVSSGHGLDTYHTVWLIEFNYISLLVMFGAFVVVLLIGGVLRLYEYFQWRALEKKYGVRNDNT
jgi:hypothetical protein